jgi:hypothetical protein
LDLDVPGSFEVALEVDVRRREIRLCFARCTGERVFDRVRLVDDAETLAASSRRSLDRDR